MKFREKESFLIGKYTAINGPGAAVRKFRKSHPHLKFGESQARALRKKYLDQEKKRPNVNKKIGTLNRGRPFMLDTVDKKVCNFLQIVKTKGGLVNLVTWKFVVGKKNISRDGFCEKSRSNLKTWNTRTWQK